MNDFSLLRIRCVTKSANRFMAMKWLKRAAQGFSPGKAPASESPCRGGGPTGSFRTRYWVDHGVEDLIDGWLAESNEACRQVAKRYRTPFQVGRRGGRSPRAEALGCSVGPLRGQESLLPITPSLPRIQTVKRNNSGSVLVYVLVLVVIAGIIGASYLTLVDNQRATTTRNLNQDGLRISTEQALLSLESTIRNELLANGEVNLAGLNHSEAAAGLSLSLSSTTDGAAITVLRVQPFADASELGEYTALLDKKDLFGQAYARQTTIDVSIVAKSTVPTCACRTSRSPMNHSLRFAKFQCRSLLSFRLRTIFLFVQLFCCRLWCYYF
jgi:Tfp pilus assembly protein PilX